MKRPTTIIAIVFALCLAEACGKETVSVPKDNAPLDFSSSFTRAPLSEVFTTFKVWTSIQKADNTITLMNGYRVNFDLSEGWTYILGEGTESQHLQRWDEGASVHRFHAGAPQENVTTISDNSVCVSVKSTTTLSETSLFTTPYVVNKHDPKWGETVNLVFNYANARVNLAFKYISSVGASLTDIKLTPPAPYASEGTMDFEYLWNIPKVKASGLTISSKSSTPLSFPDLVIPANSDKYHETSVPWLMIPDPAIAGQWTLSLKIDGIEKVIPFTQSKSWESGKSYTYRFEYTDKANLVFAGTNTELFVGEGPESGGEHNFS